MDTKPRSGLSLATIPATRHWVDGLAARKLISPDPRDFALALLHPHSNWGRWIAAILTITGTALILSGIVYFFAFNWTKIPPAYKLGSIELAILGCLLASYALGIEKRSSGKCMLLAAAVLVGVFLAVFGQIYQTGADAFNLFLMWSLLILPWTMLSQFAALWYLWLVVTNIFFILWWYQVMQPDREAETHIYTWLVLGNSLVLCLREYAATYCAWLGERWSRLAIILPGLFFSDIPAVVFILDVEQASLSDAAGALVALMLHLALYFFYRYKRPDMWALAATVLSFCVLIEIAFCRMLVEPLSKEPAPTLLLLGAATLALFTFAIVRLRRIQKKLEQSHV